MAGLKIKDAALVGSVTDDIKIPASTLLGIANTISVGLIKKKVLDINEGIEPDSELWVDLNLQGFNVDTKKTNISFKIKNPNYTEDGTEPKYINITPTLSKETVESLLKTEIDRWDLGLREISENAEITARALNELNTNKLDVLVSNTNIKTINNESILGTGNINTIGKVDTTSEEFTLYHGEIFNNYDRNFALGEFSHAEGNGTVAIGDNSHAEGEDSSTEGEESHAEGKGTLASGEHGSHAEGYRTEASGKYGSHAEGRNTTASGEASHAEGNNTQALGLQSHAEGFRLDDSYEIIEVKSSVDGILISVPLELCIIDTESEEIKVKLSETTLDKYSTFYYKEKLFKLCDIISQDHTADPLILTLKVVDSFPTMLSGELYIYIIHLAAMGDSSHTEGGNTIALGRASHAEGYGSKVTFKTLAGEPIGAHAEGTNCVSRGKGAHSEGGATLADGKYSHSEGDSTKSLALGSHSEGFETTAEGEYSHAEGKKTKASGEASHSEGFETIATSQYSHTEGFFTEASGHTSHAEGHNTQASGGASHSEGFFTKASGDLSHAEGNSTMALGDSSHAEGFKTIADNYVLHSQGLFNTKELTPSKNTFDATKILFSIGNGVSDSERSDALKMLGNGTLWVSGIGTFTGTNADETNSILKVLENFKTEVSSLKTLINNLKTENNTLRDRLNKLSVEVSENAEITARALTLLESEITVLKTNNGGKA